MNQNLKQKLFLCGAAAFAALFLFSGVMLARQYADQKQSAEAFAEIAALVQEEPEPPSLAPMEDAEPTTETDNAITAYEKYAAVYEQNHDFVGWITIDGTKINYPVMQSAETDYYLKRAFDKSYSAYGTPYVQENCILGSSDNIIIYGHHMKDGSMFAGLCQYESEDFYREHTAIHFDTLAGYGEYEIVAVFKTVAYSQDGFKYYHFVDAESEADFDEFIAQCQSLALYDTGVSAEYGDELLTLSTCEYSRNNGRMVIVAKRIAPSSAEVGGNA